MAAQIKGIPYMLYFTTNQISHTISVWHDLAMNRTHINHPTFQPICTQQDTWRAVLCSTLPSIPSLQPPYATIYTCICIVHSIIVGYSQLLSVLPMLLVDWEWPEDKVKIMGKEEDIMHKHVLVMCHTDGSTCPSKSLKQP